MFGIPTDPNFPARDRLLESEKGSQRCEGHPLWDAPPPPAAPALTHREPNSTIAPDYLGPKFWVGAFEFADPGTNASIKLRVFGLALSLGIHLSFV